MSPINPGPVPDAATKIAAILHDRGAGVDAGRARRIAEAAVDVGRRSPFIPADPQRRGCSPLELLPVDGLCLYDDERDLLTWARARLDSLAPPERPDVIAYALENLSRLRLLRLEAIPGELALEESRSPFRAPYTGEGVAGCVASAQVDREEAGMIDRHDPRRAELDASADAWTTQAGLELAADLLVEQGTGGTPTTRLRREALRYGLDASAVRAALTFLEGERRAGRPNTLLVARGIGNG